MKFCNDLGIELVPYDTKLSDFRESIALVVHKLNLKRVKFLVLKIDIQTKY